jgi:hypothetical protein
MVSSGPVIGHDFARALLGRRARNISVTVPFVLLLPLLLMGCGSSDNGVAAKTPAEILAATRAAAQNASSVHVVSTATTRLESEKLDANMARNQGRTQVAIMGMDFEVIRVGHTFYVKGNAVFDAGLERTLGVKVPPKVWLKGTTSTLGQIGFDTDIGKELPIMLSGSGAVGKGAKTKINGQPAITLKLTRKLYTGTLYVATTGQPYPLKLTKTGREHGQTTFTGWNDSVTVTPPANAIDISQLQHTNKGR